MRGPGKRHERELPVSTRGQWLRAAMVTPWFAVGAGAVTAALISLHAPHQALSFGPPAYRQCRHPHCLVPAHGSLSTSGRGARLKSPAPAPRRTRPAQPQQTAASPVAVPEPRRAAAVRVSYQLVRRDAPAFVAFFIVHSHHELDTWTLGFTLPGTRIRSVWGAAWRKSARGDGGQATGQPWPWPQSGASTVRIAVAGTGAGSAPRGCIFDGMPCTVRVLPPPPGPGRGPGGTGQGSGPGQSRPGPGGTGHGWAWGRTAGRRDQGRGQTQGRG